MAIVSRWYVYLFVLLLAGVTILTYRPGWHGGFIWDDDAYVANHDLRRGNLHKVPFG